MKEKQIPKKNENKKKKLKQKLKSKSNKLTSNNILAIKIILYFFII